MYANPPPLSGSPRSKSPSSYPAVLSAQTSPHTPSANTGGSRTNLTIPVMSPPVKMPRAFELTPESSQDSGARRISCVATNPTQFLKTASPPLSQDSKQYSP